MRLLLSEQIDNIWITLIHKGPPNHRRSKAHQTGLEAGLAGKVARVAGAP